MSSRVELVVFTLDDQRYALQLSVVERVIPAVEVTPLPKAPDVVLGVINMQGTILPVVNVRRRFRHPERELSPKDQILIARTSSRAVGLVVDAVIGLAEFSSDDVIPPKSIVPGTAYIEGVVKLGEDIVLIHNLDKFLSLDEAAALEIVVNDGGVRTRG